MTTTAPQPVASSTLRVGEVDVHFHDSGSGYPIFLLHGSGPGTTAWGSFAENIGVLSRNFRVFAPDMPGWGESGRLRDAPDPVVVAVAIMDHLGLDRAAFVGNSMGANNALRLAVHHPNRVSHLVTMGAMAPGPNIFGRGNGLTEGLEALVGAYRDPSPENLRRMALCMCFDPGLVTPEMIDQRAAAVRERPEHLEDFLAAGKPPGSADIQHLGDELARLTVPVLAIHGREDRVMSYEHSLRLLTILPNASLLLLGRCGHWAQLEHPARFNRAVHDFIENN